MTTAVKDQYVLRVKRGTPIERVMDALTSGKAYSDDELAEIGGQTQWGYRLRRIAPYFDNMAIVVDDGRQKMNYNPVGAYYNVPAPVSAPTIYQPTQPVVEVIQAPVPQPEMPESVDIRWPDAPPLIDGMGDKFRTPSWFGIMKAMVKAGRHIALQGPPGVGKDTAVQELAAMEGKPLVTIGGDGGFRRRDLVGGVQIANGRSFHEVAEFAAAVVNGWWALVTEVNAADADALIFLNQIMAAPYVIQVGGKSYPVHPDFRLFVSYNAGLVGTKPLPQSFKDRFYSIQVPFFKQSQLEAILVSHGAAYSTSTTEIAKYGVTLWDAHVRGQLRYQVTSRRLMDAVELLNLGLVMSVREALELAVVAAIDSPTEAKVASQLISMI